jgi:hypothetical protein
MLNSFIFDSSPQRTSSHARGALLRVDGRIVEIAREVDYKAIFCGRGTRRAMTAAANRNLEIVRSSVLQRERNIVIVFHKGNNTSFALSVSGPASYSLGVSLIVRGHDIPFERLLEFRKTRHPRQELLAKQFGKE